MHNEPPNLSRDAAREVFKKSGLTYSVLTRGNLKRLRNLINSRMVQSGLIKGSFRCHQRAKFFDGGAEIKCKAYYFNQREAVTFNDDGFIGFAGWADDENIQPVIQGFLKWVEELKQQ